MPAHLRKRQLEKEKGELEERDKKISYVYTPSDAEIQQILLEKKRAIALAKVSKYITEEDISRDEAAKVMAGSGGGSIVGPGAPKKDDVEMNKKLDGAGEQT